MKKFGRITTGIAGLAVLGWIAGCQEEVATGTAASTKAAHAKAEQDHGHEHGAGKHEHGHEHSAGPHGGTVADWGGGTYHAEFTVDRDKQEATVYVLGSDEKTPTPIKAEKILLSIGDPEVQTDLLPVPMDGETNGLASRFVGKHEKLGIVQEYAGTLTVEIDGTPYSGDFKEEAHDHK